MRRELFPFSNCSLAFSTFPLLPLLPLSLSLSSPPPLPLSSASLHRCDLRLRALVSAARRVKLSEKRKRLRLHCCRFFPPRGKRHGRLAVERNRVWERAACVRLRPDWRERERDERGKRRKRQRKRCLCFVLSGLASSPRLSLSLSPSLSGARPLSPSHSHSLGLSSLRLTPGEKGESKRRYPLHHRGRFALLTVSPSPLPRERRGRHGKGAAWLHLHLRGADGAAVHPGHAQGAAHPQRICRPYVVGLPPPWPSAAALRAARAAHQENTKGKEKAGRFAVACAARQWRPCQLASAPPLPANRRPLLAHAVRLRSNSRYETATAVSPRTDR